ncbi:breast cancer metastasis-suppressor 1-like protein [Anopheles ziemanni]|uniref:breast cancer metastasis-suppressor 1-like protein n=1 Tax=Anopheles coustani TaxID=139045 RepID=UPI0026584AF0|nr:breast cancer metastasis-suppressor 1-like protein [Anopheles coustani]XP_058175552.1 breast cancer metastasis-suppressor 1-like protein [Anopheles ziemanni]
MSSNQRSTLEESPEEKTKHEYESRRSEDNEYDSDEDTDEASETESGSSTNQRTIDEQRELKEQIYREKLADLMHEMELLKMRKHPDYLRRVETLTVELEDRLMLNELHRDHQLQWAQREYEKDIVEAEKEFQEEEAKLKERLIAKCENDKKLFLREFAAMKLRSKRLDGDSIDVEPVTRKLRSDWKEPLPVPEKRRKLAPRKLVFLLDKKEIEHDLELVFGGKPPHSGSSQQYDINEGASTSSGGLSGVEPVTRKLRSHSKKPLPDLKQYDINEGASTSSGGPSGVNPSTPPRSGRSRQNGINEGASTSTGAGASGNNPSTSAHSSGLNSGGLGYATGQSYSNLNGALTSGARRSRTNQSYNRQPSSSRKPSHSLLRQQRLSVARIEDAIGADDIWVKKPSDGKKVCIFLSHLRQGKVSIKRRGN